MTVAILVLAVPSYGQQAPAPTPQTAPEKTGLFTQLSRAFRGPLHPVPGTRDDVDASEEEPFIIGVAHNRVKLGFRGVWREPQLLDSITPYDVRWMAGRLAKLSQPQWMDAFRAGGYSEAEAARLSPS